MNRLIISAVAVAVGLGCAPAFAGEAYAHPYAIMVSTAGLDRQAPDAARSLRERLRPAAIKVCVKREGVDYTTASRPMLSDCIDDAIAQALASQR